MRNKESGQRKEKSKDRWYVCDHSVFKIGITKDSPDWNNYDAYRIRNIKGKS